MTQTTTEKPDVGTRIRLARSLGYEFWSGPDSPEYGVGSPGVGTLGTVVDDPRILPEQVAITLDGWRYNSERDHTIAIWNDRFEIVTEEPAPAPLERPVLAHLAPITVLAVQYEADNCRVGQVAYIANRNMAEEGGVVRAFQGDGYPFVVTNWIEATVEGLDPEIRVGDVVEIVSLSHAESFGEEYVGKVASVVRAQRDSDGDIRVTIEEDCDCGEEDCEEDTEVYVTHWREPPAPAPLPFPAAAYIPGANPDVTEGDRVVCDAIQPDSLGLYVGKAGRVISRSEPGGCTLVMFDDFDHVPGWSGNSWLVSSWHREPAEGSVADEVPLEQQPIKIGDAVRVTGFLGSEAENPRYSATIGQLGRVVVGDSCGDNVRDYKWLARLSNGQRVWAIVEKVDAASAATLLPVPFFSAGQQVIYIGNQIAGDSEGNPGSIGELFEIEDPTPYEAGMAGEYLYVRQVGQPARRLRLNASGIVEATAEKRIEFEVKKTVAAAVREEQARVIRVAMEEGQRRGWCGELEQVLREGLKYDLDSFSRRASGRIVVELELNNAVLPIRHPGDVDAGTIADVLASLLGGTRAIGGGAARLVRVTDVSGVTVRPASEGESIE